MFWDFAPNIVICTKGMGGWAKGENVSLPQVRRAKRGNSFLNRFGYHP